MAKFYSLIVAGAQGVWFSSFNSHVVDMAHLVWAGPKHAWLVVAELVLH